MPARRRALAALLVVVALGAALRAADLGEPWSGRDFKSAFGCHTTGAYARNFVEHGFLEARLMPYGWRLELASGEVVRDWYTHHPAAYAVLSGLAVQTLGTEAWALKLPWLLVAVASIPLVWRALRTALGEPAALVGALLYATVPLAAYFASMPWVEFAVVGLHAAVWREYALWLRDGRGRRVAAMAAAFLAGGLLGWSMALALPGLLAHAAATCVGRGGLRGGARRLLPVLALPAAAALAALVHAAHVEWAVPGSLVGEAGRTLAGARRSPVPVGTFLGYQAGALVAGLTVPVLLVAAAGLVRQAGRALRGAQTAGETLVWPMLLPGAAYVALFPSRSVNHDFFWALSLPGLVALAALELVAWRRTALARAPRLGAAAWAAGLLALVAVAAAGTLERTRETRSDLLHRLATAPWLAPVLADPDAVVVGSAGQALSLHAASRAPVLAPVRTREDVEELRRTLLGRLPPGRRVVLLFDAAAWPFDRELHAWLSDVAPSERHAVEGADGRRALYELFDLGPWLAGGRLAAAPGQARGW